MTNQRPSRRKPRHTGPVPEGSSHIVTERMDPNYLPPTMSLNASTRTKAEPPKTSPCLEKAHEILIAASEDEAAVAVSTLVDWSYWAEEEIDRLTEHSTTLNTLSWKMADALGEVPEGAIECELNPLELLDRVFAESKAHLDAYAKMRAHSVLTIGDLKHMARDSYQLGREEAAQAIEALATDCRLVHEDWSYQNAAMIARGSKPSPIIIAAEVTP